MAKKHDWIRLLHEGTLLANKTGIGKQSQRFLHRLGSITVYPKEASRFLVRLQVRYVLFLKLREHLVLYEAAAPSQSKFDDQDTFRVGSSAPPRCHFDNIRG
jgi:hypothetical protein